VNVVPVPAQRLPLRLDSGVVLAVAALLLFTCNVLLHFPGDLTNDSRGQYQEALSGVYTDWHPPVMAWVWSFLATLAEGPQTVFLMHVTLHWIGFALTADGLRRSGRPGAGLLALAGGIFPFLLFMNGMVVKDVGMYVAFTAAFGIAAWYRLQGRRTPWPAVAAAVLVLLYGSLVRNNAVFALGPILLYVLGVGRGLRVTGLIFWAIVVALFAIPASKWFNSGFLQARDTGALRSLVIFDLAGIGRQAGRPELLLPPDVLPAAQLERCYSPYWWDSFSPWGPCRFVHEAFERRVGASNGPAMKLWLEAIGNHPVAYAEHRLRHFNSSLLFLVPAKHNRYAVDYRGEDPSYYLQPPTPREITLDYVKKNPAFWPILWVAAAIVMLRVIAVRRQQDEADLAALALLVSSLGYAAGYLVVGVATDVRYYLWPMAAGLLAVPLLLPAFLEIRRQRPREAIALVGALVAVVLAGLVFRVFDLAVFMV